MQHGEDLEWIAGTYGYPINKWNVSCHVVDFSCIFLGLFKFNEDISLGDVGSATDISSLMFQSVFVFNMNLLCWNV
jgi:hypothetical protein